MKTGLQRLINVMPNDTFLDVLFRAFAVGSREQNILISMFCWSLWNRRNKWVWDRINGSAFGVRAAATNLLKDWREARAADEKRNVQGGMHLRKWSKPPSGWTIINVDAATFQDGSIGVGSIARDSNGKFLKAKNVRIAGRWQPREAEAISLKEALSWMKDLNSSSCIFETDSKALVEACNGNLGEAYFDTIVLDCLKHFDNVLVEFTCRSANSVAHLVARAAYSLTDLGEWHVTPAFIHDVLENDNV